MAITDYLKERTVVLKVKDLFFDIDAYSYSLSQMGAEVGRQNDTVATETESEFGRRTLRRCMEQRVALLRQTLKKCLKDTEDQAEKTDVLGTADSFTFVFQVSKEAQDSVFEPVKDLMHEYVVKGTLKDWYDYLGLTGGDRLSPRLSELETRMKKLIYHRAMPAVTRS